MVKSLVCLRGRSVCRDVLREALGLIESHKFEVCALNLFRRAVVQRGELMPSHALELHDDV